MREAKSQLPVKIEIENVDQYNNNTYICKCHWSTLRLLFTENG